MIESILPLSKKKMDILRYIYEHQSVHLRKIAAELHIHPYIVKKHIDALVSKKILVQQKAGKTILLSINILLGNSEHILYVIECYKQATEHTKLKNIIQLLQQHFSRKSKILSCIVFGSYARGAATKESDVDVLFITTDKSAKTEITKTLSQLNALMNVTFSPIIMTKDDFKIALEAKDPATVTLLKPSQHIVVLGIEYFLKTTI